jgi:PAS domain S-box-containing protein
MQQSKVNAGKSNGDRNGHRNGRHAARPKVGAAAVVEGRLRALLNVMPDGVITLDGAGVIGSINSTAEQMFGYQLEELVGQELSLLVSDTHRAELDLAVGRSGRRGSALSTYRDCEIEGRRRDGGRFPLLLRLRELRFGGESVFVGVAQDISERRRLEEDARKSLAGKVGESVSRLASASAELLAATVQQATGAQEQAAAINQTITTVDEVTQTAEQSSQRAKTVADAAQRSVEVSTAGRKAVDDTVTITNALKENVEVIAENILTLAEQAQSIGEIIATVSDIADQSNLLALNAAIEASRAGEQGRGFQVVAGEVKALAEQSKKATVQVRQILGDIQKKMNKAVLSTEEGTKSADRAARSVVQAGEMIRSLAVTIAEAAQSAVQIVASAGQQATGMNQISQAMRDIQQVTTQNVASNRQVERTSQDLNALSSAIKDMVIA